MKTKLLKKLRAEARKKFWIEYHPSSFTPYWVKGYRQAPSTCFDSFGKLETAIEELKKYRRDYILTKTFKRVYD